MNYYVSPFSKREFLRHIQHTLYILLRTCLHNINTDQKGACADCHEMYSCEYCSEPMLVQGNDCQLHCKDNRCFYYLVHCGFDNNDRCSHCRITTVQSQHHPVLFESTGNGRKKRKLKSIKYCFGDTLTSKPLPGKESKSDQT
jgi:hypothetical protein